jgi:LuxR family transcriptional regulator, quorum-sensing system regulator SolR
MHLLHDKIYESLSAAPNIDEFFAVLCCYALKMGFEYCCYGLRKPFPVSNRPVHIFDSYPAGWMEHYQNSGYLDIDPIVKRGARTLVPLEWDSDLFCEAKDMWDCAQSFGLRHGVSQSSWSEHGSYGLLSMARSKDPISAKELAACSERIVWLSSVSHVLIAQFLDKNMGKNEDIRLTSREIEILCWTCDGKTSYEIGRIINISASTVNFHINNILIKLNTSNKVQAAVKAIRLGLIN